MPKVYVLLFCMFSHFLLTTVRNHYISLLDKHVEISINYTFSSIFNSDVTIYKSCLWISDIDKFPMTMRWTVS